MVDRTVKPVEKRIEIAEERESSGAQIRTLLNEQRKTIIAEHCEKVSQHEFQTAQQDFREVHQQNLTEMEELRKFQSSTLDTLTQPKFIEDQNTKMELSGRLQELPIEVNCMNDSKDFQDAESVRSGNSHVTSKPMLFPNAKRFCKSTCIFISFLSSRIESMGDNHWETASHVYSGEEW